MTTKLPRIIFSVTAIQFLLALFFTTAAFSQSNEKTTIVFVCEHGGARSTIASVYFNKMAREKHLSMRSIFRALTPDSAISKETKKGLLADGFETADLLPVALTSTDVGPGTVLISLDCNIPELYHTDMAWNGIPAISYDYIAARNAIIKHLDQLVSDLKKNQPNK